MNFDVIDLGRTDYGKALEFQYELLGKRQNNLIRDTLILTEHEPVITLGIRGSRENILLSPEQMDRENVKVYEVGRGGDVTYHGPGQLVGYPIFDLGGRGRNIREFVWNIEEAFIRLLQEDYGIMAHREDKKYTGVWVEDRKITAIGIAVKHWVTMHGFAFNVNTNLEHFGWIRPCGITDRGVVSLEELTGKSHILKDVADRLVRIFQDVFGGGHV
ncbi:MAG: lipoyl(octanoyl) transferase LipB [Clostridia bacterium]